MAEVHLTETLNVVGECFQAAERNVRQIVREIRPDASEEAITNDFEAELAKCLRLASDQGLIAGAFVRDLIRAHPYASTRPFEHAAAGLIAYVSWHDRAMEARTGGDFGLVLVRPIVRNGPNAMELISGNRQGLLIQAKKKRAGRPWGRLTKNQRLLFPSFRPHGAFLLYRFDNANTLGPFGFQLCRRRLLITVTEWFRDDTFPDCRDAPTIISQLGDGSIGTSNPKVIGTAITPPGQRTLIIRIDWGDGRPPGSQIPVTISPSHEPQVIKQQVLQY